MFGTAPGYKGLEVTLGVAVDPWLYKQPRLGSVGHRTPGPRVAVLQVVEGEVTGACAVFDGLETVCLYQSLHSWLYKQPRLGSVGHRTPGPRVAVLQVVKGELTDAYAVFGLALMCLSYSSDPWLYKQPL
jgi:hypothetical protein